MGIKIRKRIHQVPENPITIKKNSSKPREPHKGTILRTQATTKNKYRDRTVRRKYIPDDKKKT
jgi:hypothetical protein